MKQNANIQLFGAAIIAMSLAIVPCGGASAVITDAESTFPIPPLLRSIHGETISAQSGLPVAGVKVMLTGRGMMQSQQSDASGQFRFDGLAPGSYQIRANGGAPVVVTVAGYDSFVTLLVD